MDYISILDGRIPSYYEVAKCENDDLIISYWFFYGYKDDCPMLPGFGKYLNLTKMFVIILFLTKLHYYQGILGPTSIGAVT